jgi:hypothetical protein
VEDIVADMKLATDRRELAELTGIAVSVLNQYRPKLMELPQLNNYAEDCTVCDTVGAVVAVNWYGWTVNAAASPEPVSGQCCRSCVGRALQLEDADPYAPVELEYLPLVPKAGA